MMVQGIGVPGGNLDLTWLMIQDSRLARCCDLRVHGS
jgi:hypothetical protein